MSWRDKEFSVYPPLPKIARFKRRWIIAATVVVGAIIAAAVAFGLVNRPTLNRAGLDTRNLVPDRQLLADSLKGIPAEYDASMFFRAPAEPDPEPQQNEPKREAQKLGPPLHGELGNIELKQRRAGRATLRRRPDEASASPIQFALRAAGTGGRPSVRPAAAGHPSVSERQRNPKESFLLERRNGGLGAGLVRAAPDYAVLAGTVIPATLVTAINSDLPGQIVAQVTAPVFDSVRGDAVLIPQGSRLIGDYDSEVEYAQARVLVVWHRLLYPDGRSVDLNNLAAVDASGAAGLRDKVNRHLPGLLGSVALGAAISAIADAARDDQDRVSVSVGDGIADAGNVVTQALTQRRLNVQPTLEIRAGTDFFVFVSRDLLLPPIG